MSKKHKNKIKKLSEEDYNNYIMALKDEKPPKIVREAAHMSDNDKQG